MSKLNFHPYYYVCLVAFIFMVIMDVDAVDEDRKVYIVYLGSLAEKKFSPLSQHLRILDSVLESGSSTDSLVRSYKRSFNGFAAKLTDREREKLANREDVVSIFPNKLLQLQTTRSWDFMGLTETIKQDPTLEGDVIVGVLDTGIWPESKSFDDKGFGPPPKKWKGVCSGGKNFTCNKKVIGARIYNSQENSDISARDTEGHGTHTASTAAGNKVENASFFGLAKGNARGGVPSARIAVYKVCFPLGCASADIMAAFDDAISDGVDIISVSLGSETPSNLDADPIAIGSFHSMARGILTLNSAGNNGPDKSTTASVAPWMVGVAAGTTDRLIIDKVVLGNGKTLIGRSLNPFSLNGTEFPLVYGTDASSTCDDFAAQACNGGCLDPDLVKGKIVLCKSYTGDLVSHTAGAIGSIMLDFGDGILPLLPASALSEQDFEIVESYYNSTKNPQANILKSEAIKDSSAPVVAHFSARGPNIVVAEIIKPDITAPGIDILAAYSPVARLSPSPADTRSAEYSILSGTSMACPHASGVAAYVKSLHPDWSPSAIKSALMTSARPMNPTTNPDGEFAYGSGHVDPIEARNPGLVYDALKDDYIKMLCSIGYNTTKVRFISGDNSVSCPEDNTGSSKDLNYPSMAVKVEPAKSFKVEFPRTVTNVGSSNSTYKAKVTTTSSNIKIQVKPSTLSFKSIKEKKSFVVTVSGQGLTRDDEPVASALLVWSDGTHDVRSPIVAYTDMIVDF